MLVAALDAATVALPAMFTHAAEILHIIDHPMISVIDN